MNVSVQYIDQFSIPILQKRDREIGGAWRWNGWGAEPHEALGGHGGGRVLLPLLLLLPPFSKSLFHLVLGT